MRAAKVIAVLFVVYAGLVAAFEARLGYKQPTFGSTVVITTFDEDGTAHDRVVSRLESGGQVYVAANHWPRAWYRRALRNPEVRVTIDGEAGEYRAVPISGEERERVSTENAVGLRFRVLTGFPPRAFLRLDPR